MRPRSPASNLRTVSAPLRVFRHESELGRWELASRAPEARLRGYVHEYEGYVEHGSPTPVLRQQVPTPRLPLIVNFGAPWHVAGSKAGPHVAFDSFVAGLGVASSYVAAAGPASCVQVNLTPLGAHMLFGVAMHELANRVVPLDDVLPRSEGTLVVERLEAAPTWDERFELLDRALLARLARAREPSRDVAWAWRALEQTRGRVPIGWICDRLGRSRRHLAASFREQVGLPPKTVARIIRFDHAVSKLALEGAELARIAFECGYYDQAHLNRDFRKLAGTPPGELMRRIVPDGGVIV